MRAAAILLMVSLVAFAEASQSPRASSIPTSIEQPSHRVKLFHDGDWGYICANGWDSNDARVICRMQGYWHGTGTAQIVRMMGGEKIYLDNVRCTGNESDITQCPFNGWGIPSCPEGGVGGVDCINRAQSMLRLADGFGPWEGRVEIQQDGMWRPVCGDGWDNNDAAVVCRSLGIRSDGGLAHLDRKYGVSLTPPLITNTNCMGTETDMALCKADLLSGASSCLHAGVECYNCGGEFQTVTGVVQSQNFPDPYPSNLMCLYVIRPPDNGDLYKLEFSHFQTEECCDRVQVGLLTNASSFPDGGKTYGGLNMPPRLLGKAFVISFHTDGSRSLGGFRAEWKPARVEDVVSVSCNGGQFEIWVDIAFLKRLYPQSSETSIGLADPACTGRIVNDSLLIRANTDACGTTVETNGDYHIYNNFLVDRIFASQSVQIVRQHRWKVPISCKVLRTDDFHMHYDPYPALDSRSDDVRRDVNTNDDVSSGLSTRELRESISLTVHFDVRSHVYTDASFSTEFFGPLTRELGQDLYFRVRMESGESDLILVVNSCTAQPAIHYNSLPLTYTLINNSCPVDVDTRILSTQPHYTDIHLVTFEFAGDYPQVMVRCSYTICPRGDASAECQQTCVRPGRRDEEQAEVEDQPIISRRRSTRNAHFVSLGPIVIEKD